MESLIGAQCVSRWLFFRRAQQIEAPEIRTFVYFLGGHQFWVMRLEMSVLVGTSKEGIVLYMVSYK